MKTSDFDFHLPQELIAQTPLQSRDQSRMLVCDRSSGAFSHHSFHELPDFLNSGDVLVINRSRVIPARLLGTKRGTGVAWRNKYGFCQRRLCCFPRQRVFTSTITNH